jgi:hypothetical protein
LYSLKLILVDELISRHHYKLTDLVETRILDVSKIANKTRYHIS